MAGMMRGAIQGGIGTGLEKAAGNIMNAYFMKKNLDVTKQVADAQKLKAQSDTRKTDAYVNYLNNKDIAERFVRRHADMPQFLQSLQAGQGGPGSTANQLATRYAPMLGEVMSEDGPPSAEGPGPPRGVARAQDSPAPNRDMDRFSPKAIQEPMQARRFSPAPEIPSPAMPPIPNGDPRSLLGPQPQQDFPMFGDHDAT